MLGIEATENKTKAKSKLFFVCVFLRNSVTLERQKEKILNFHEIITCKATIPNSKGTNYKDNFGVTRGLPHCFYHMARCMSRRVRMCL
jgi:hypothetical protein